MNTTINKHHNQLSAFLSLTKRHLKVFFKNIPTVIFTMMVPLTIFAVYLIFLRQVQLEQIGNFYDGFADLSMEMKHKVSALADSWMISGVLGVSCVTVSMNCQYIMVKDKENMLNRDMISSPINPNVIMFSYFAFNIIVTFLINLAVFFISLIVLVCYNAYLISVIDFFALIGVLLYSTVAAALFSFLIASFVNTEAVMSPIIAICCAAIGFLIGAYLPNNMMPPYINNITGFFPGTYSVGLFRNFLMHGQVEQILQSGEIVNPDGLITALEQQFNIYRNADGSVYVTVYFFGVNINSGYMVFAMFVFIIAFLIADLIVLHFKRFFVMNKKFFKKVKKDIEEKEGELHSHHAEEDD